MKELICMEQDSLLQMRVNFICGISIHIHRFSTGKEKEYFYNDLTKTGMFSKPWRSNYTGCFNTKID